jgi:hypothetical protein
LSLLDGTVARVVVHDDDLVDNTRDEELLDSGPDGLRLVVRRQHD